MKEVKRGQEWEEGDLVWARVEGHPQWPGQVMNPLKSLAKVKASRKEGHVLVSFFGDQSYGWFLPGLLVDFKEHYETRTRVVVKKTKDFVLAVEECKEILDRREGRTPVTQHEPIDFLRDRVEYADVEGMNLVERVGWVAPGACEAAPPARMLAHLRALARCPPAALSDPGRRELERVGVTVEEQLAVWLHYFQQPPELQRRMLPDGLPGDEARRKEHPTPKARKSAGGKLKGAHVDAPDADDDGRVASRKVQKAGPPKPKKSKQQRAPDQPASASKAKRARGAASREDDGDEAPQHKRARNGEASAAAAAALDGPQQEPDQQFMALYSAASAAQAHRRGRARGRRRGGEGPSDQPEAPGAVPVKVLRECPPGEEFEEFEDLEEQCASGGVMISQPGKIGARKLALRWRQFARNVAVPDCYVRVLNPVNLAGFFKYREALRTQTTLPSNPETSDATRDVLVGAWRKLNPHQRPDERPEPTDEDVVAVCLAPGAPVTLRALSCVPLVRPHREQELRALHELGAFWRRRGFALPPLVRCKMQLDVFELLERVFLAGGYWAVTAAQTPALNEPHRSWQYLVCKCWIPRPDDSLPCLGATLQAWYHDWLLPFEAECAAVHGVRTCLLPAEAFRRLAGDPSDMWGLGRLPLAVRALAAARSPAQRHLTLHQGCVFLKKLMVHKLGPERAVTLLAGLPRMDEALAALGARGGALEHEEPAPDVALSDDEEAAGDEERYSPPPQPSRGRNATGRKSLATSKQLRNRAAPRRRREPESDAYEDEPVGEAGPARAAQARLSAAKSVLESLHKHPVVARRRQTGGDDKPRSRAAADGGADGALGGAALAAVKTEEAPAPAAVANPLKRQVPVKTEPAEAPRKHLAGPCFLLTQFDSRYRLPDVQEMEAVVKRKYELSQRERTRTDPSRKKAIFAFNDFADATAAARELPQLLRKGLHKPSDFQIRAEVCSYKRAAEEIGPPTERPSNYRNDRVGQPFGVGRGGGYRSGSRPYGDHGNHRYGEEPFYGEDEWAGPGRGRRDERDGSGGGGGSGGPAPWAPPHERGEYGRGGYGHAGGGGRDAPLHGVGAPPRGSPHVGGPPVISFGGNAPPGAPVVVIMQQSQLQPAGLGGLHHHHPALGPPPMQPLAPPPAQLTQHAPPPAMFGGMDLNAILSSATAPGAPMTSMAAPTPAPAPAPAPPLASEQPPGDVGKSMLALLDLLQTSATS